MPLADLGAVLAAGYGVDGAVRRGALEFLERPIPSGGGLYPLELYVLARAIGGVEPGVYHYAPVVAGLEQLRTVELPSRFAAAFPSTEAGTIRTPRAAGTSSSDRLPNRGRPRSDRPHVAR